MPNFHGWKTELEDGLVMRGATVDDADHLGDYNAEMHSDPGEPHPWMREWTRDLVLKPHPGMSLDDLIVVEDTKNGQIVSSCAYFNQTWSYCSIPVPFGRPELVSTHPDYRNRGLIRRQFDLMHRWADERGHIVQGITGIPYYYRQFGYELALPMGTARDASLYGMPEWKEGESKSVRLRKAERSDVPFILEARQSTEARSLFAPLATAAEVEYQLFDRSELSTVAKMPYIIEDQAGTAIGYTLFVARLEYDTAEVQVIDFAKLSMYREFTEPFLKSLRAVLEKLPREGGKPLRHVSMHLAESHPVLTFLGKSFAARGRSYAWYMRVPDLPKLLTLIAPKLEERLAGTVFEGLTAEKTLSFYRTGLKLDFKDGRLSTVEAVKFPEARKSTASLPDLTFLQLLFGRRSVKELGDHFADVYVHTPADELLLDTLFPVVPSDTRFAIS